MFWSEIGSGFGEPGGTDPYQEFRGVPPPPQRLGEQAYNLSLGSHHGNGGSTEKI